MEVNNIRILRKLEKIILSFRMKSKSYYFFVMLEYNNIFMLRKVWNCNGIFRYKILLASLAHSHRSLMSSPTFKEMVEFAFYFKLKEIIILKVLHSHRDTCSSHSIIRKCFYNSLISHIIVMN